ncbi:MAG: hypothetical protein ACK55I_15285, partial [bacterium]
MFALPHHLNVVVYGLFGLSDRFCKILLPKQHMHHILPHQFFSRETRFEGSFFFNITAGTYPFLQAISDGDQLLILHRGEI